MQFDELHVYCWSDKTSECIYNHVNCWSAAEISSCCHFWSFQCLQIHFYTAEAEAYVQVHVNKTFTYIAQYRWSV